MSIDLKYKEMIEKASLAVAALSNFDTGMTQTMRRLLPQPDEDFEKYLRTLMQQKATDRQKKALNELNYAYMEFISECKKRSSHTKS